MRTPRPIFSLVIVTALALGLLASPSAAADDARDVPPRGTSCTSAAPLDPNGPTDCGYIVFADATTQDLWITSTMGDTFRLTRTRFLIERNPSVAGPWVFYDARKRGTNNRNIWMMSLLDESLGRVRVTERRSNDWDPTAVLPNLCCTPEQMASAPTTAQELRAAAGTPRGIFFTPLLGYSSNRLTKQENPPADCGTEIFAEWFLLTGPEQISTCDGHDKIDAEFSYSTTQLAYSGYPFGTRDPQVFVQPMGGPPVQVTTDGRNAAPTWDFASWAGGSAPQQPAGDEWVIFGRRGAGLYEVEPDGASYGPTMFQPEGDERYIAPELEGCGCGILWLRRTAAKSQIEIFSDYGDGVITPPKYWVQSADWFTFFFV